MIGISRQVVRVALLILLFQAVCPVFLPATVRNERTFDHTVISAEHAVMVFPVLLKEKEEIENAESFSDSDASPCLLDLASHGLHLATAHNHQGAGAYQAHEASRPKLFRMFCTLLI